MPKKKFYESSEFVSLAKAWDKILREDGSYGIEFFDRLRPGGTPMHARNIADQAPTKDTVYSYDHATEHQMLGMETGDSVDPECKAQYWRMVGRYRWYLKRNKGLDLLKGRCYGSKNRKGGTISPSTIVRWFDAYAETSHRAAGHSKRDASKGITKYYVRREVDRLIEAMKEGGWDD